MATGEYGAAGKLAGGVSTPEEIATQMMNAGLRGDQISRYAEAAQAKTNAGSAKTALMAELANLNQGQDLVGASPEYIQRQAASADAKRQKLYSALGLSQASFADDTALDQALMGNRVTPEAVAAAIKAYS